MQVTEACRAEGERREGLSWKGGTVKRRKKKTVCSWSVAKSRPWWWWWPALLFIPSISVCVYRLSSSSRSSSSCCCGGGGNDDDGGHLHINESCRSHAADPIYFSGTTDRQERRGKASAGELPNYSKLQHFHLHIGPVRPATIVPVGFFLLFFFHILFHSLLLLLLLPLLLLLCATTTRSGVTLIGSSEFKGPVSS